jgi:hypothetical protein
METVYIETTIVSYLVANPSRDPILAAHQQLTRQWWQDQRSAFHCLVSDEVLKEAARGSAEYARLRRQALQNVPTLPITVEVENLADAILQSGSLPAATRSDAIHVAAATLARAEFLLTWNCRHLANPHLQKPLRALMTARGLTLPEICTPIELGGQ